MERYIALFRGINVGGHRKVPMAQLRSFLQELPIEDVQTYIQSGNVVFTAQKDNERSLEKSIAEQMGHHFGFEVPVVVRPVAKIAQIFHMNPFLDKPDFNLKNSYFVMLHRSPEVTYGRQLAALGTGSEEAILLGDCVYLYCHKGYGKANITNNAVEKLLKVPATTRNFTTLKKLLEMANALDQ